MRSNVRTGWIAVGGTLTALAVLGVALAVWAEVTRPSTAYETVTRPPHSLTSSKVVVDTIGPVDISIVAGATGRLSMTRGLLWTGDRPRVTEEWEGDTLRIGVTCPGNGHEGGTVCRADYTLTLPAATDVEARSPEGLVTATGVSGDLRLSTTYGDVVVDDARGTLWARTEQGSVTGNNLRSAEADVEIGGGNATLRFAGPPDSVRAVVRTAGDVEVTVPPGDGYRVEADARSKNLDIQLDPEASRKITALVTEGNLRIFSSDRAGN
ncbi:DUF4097 domain-containing protein [Streptosporangium sp. 'caverna']|uniref:DUF4097 domain-containing protein n=1 Tax=Streptosporangium sp. 'caverna' TaxID=2202249 RepID=UPI0013A6F037|nr:DUF4097 domain-containing protein [Streptosporangium sp. 'caverna']